MNLSALIPPVPKPDEKPDDNSSAAEISRKRIYHWFPKIGEKKPKPDIVEDQNHTKEV